MTYREIVAQVAEETGLTQLIVDRTYKAYWKVIRQYVTSLPLNKDLSDEEFLQLRPNINIPSLGKFNVTLDKYHTIKRILNLKKQRSHVTHQED